MTAVIKALLNIKKDNTYNIIVYTDSKYVQTGISEWIHGWKRNNWKTKGNKPVKNLDLWKELDEVSKLFNIEWRWVKGHSDHPLNDKADDLANLGTLKV